MLLTFRRVAAGIGTRTRFSTAIPRAIESTDPFHRIDLRIGKIIAVDNHPSADHLFIEKVDVPTDNLELPNPRTIVSGLAPYMAKDALLNKHVVVVANMKPSKFRGVLSQGMLLAASKDDQVQVLEAPEGSILGERVTLQDTELTTPDDVLRPKQNVFEQVAPYLKTNGAGHVCYKDQPLTTSAGQIHSTMLHADVS